MSCVTSSLPVIGDTGSVNAAYISGLVMMDVTMSCCKGRSVHCRRWDLPFYVSYLFLGDSCRADWHVTTLVPFSSLFYLLLTLCTSCRAYLCVTTLVPTGSILRFMPFLYLSDEMLGVLTPLFCHFYLVHCYCLGNLCI